MSSHFSLHIVSPSAAMFDAPVQMVEVPGLEGDFGVLPGHAPTFSMLRPGVITVHMATKERRRFFATSGYADVTPKGCTILSEHIQDLSEISVAEAQAAVAHTEKDVADAQTDAERESAQKRLNAARALLTALHG